jgi:hypothetical protein
MMAGPRITHLLVARFVLLIALGCAATLAPAFEVYHSPGDDGTAGAMPAAVEVGAGIVTLHLYVSGSVPGVASPVDAACSGAEAAGDEICAWELTLEAQDGLQIAGFSPAPGVVHAQPSAGIVRANGVHAVTPAPAPRKIGDLGVVASALPASLRLGAATVVDAALVPQALTPVVIASGVAGDSDGDGVADPDDNCSEHANAAQRDTDGDGYGNRCDADFNGDGAVNFLDLGIMKSRFFTADPDADLNGDGAVNFLDLGILKSLFFKPPGPSGVLP